MTRRRAAEPLAVRPTVWSTRTLAALWGCSERRLNEELARRPNIPRSRLGHVVLLDDRAVAALLDDLRVDSEAPHADDGVDEVSSAAEVLRALGLRRSA